MNWDGIPGAIATSMTMSVNTDVNHAAPEDQVVIKPVLPAKPEAPLSSDCCGNGCAMCVFDVYEQELALWRKECEQIRNGELAESTYTQCPTVCPKEYHTFQIVSISKETNTCSKYKFTIPNQQCLQYSVGQHLILRWKSQDKVLTRQYTIINEPMAKGYFEVLIKLYPDGAMSNYIHTWNVGDHIEWRGPLGHFAYTPNMHPWILLLAAGTGIAPMIQVIRQVLGNEQDETRLRLIYACRTYSDILSKVQLDAWQDYWNFSVLYVLSQEQSKSGTKTRSSDWIHRGRLDETLLRQELQQLDCERVKMLVCGTKSFNRDMVDSVKRIGLSEKHYFVF